jgi:putative tryptophan/tyrosine transport system substrate-binding protein
MINRRVFVVIVGAGMLAVPQLALAQQAGKVWRIGWLGNGTRVSRETNTLMPFRDGLRELGYVEGTNVVIDALWSDDHEDRLDRNAVELVRRNVDVIVTHGSLGGRAARKATATIPIVIATSSDLVKAKLVQSLARPGGNITGTSDQTGELMINKSLEMIGEVLPGPQRVAVLWYRETASIAREVEALQVVAHQRGVLVLPLVARDMDDVPRLIDMGVKDRARALIVMQDAWTLDHRATIIRLAVAKRLPPFAGARLYAEAGALVSYGADLPATYKRAAFFVDKIFKGAKPGEIPVEQPTKFELVINLKTAKALGLTIPPSLLARADQIIE